MFGPPIWRVVTTKMETRLCYFNKIKQIISKFIALFRVFATNKSFHFLSHNRLSVPYLIKLTTFKQMQQRGDCNLITNTKSELNII